MIFVFKIVCKQWVWGAEPSTGLFHLNMQRHSKLKNEISPMIVHQIYSAPTPEDGLLGDAAVKDIGTSQTSAGQSNVGVKQFFVADWLAD